MIFCSGVTSVKSASWYRGSEGSAARAHAYRR